MATKKHHVVKRRKHTPMAAKKTKRRHTRSKGFLNDLMNPTVAMTSAKIVAGGAGGGIAAILAHKLVPATTSKIVRVVGGGVVGFLSAVMGAPSIGSGFTGGVIALTFQNGLLNDGMEKTEFADDKSLEEMPLYLDAAGEPFVIEEDPNTGESYTRYLSEEEKQMINY